MSGAANASGQHPGSDIPPPPAYDDSTATKRYFVSSTKNYGIDEGNFKYVAKKTVKTEYQSSALSTPKLLHSFESNIRSFQREDIPAPHETEADQAENVWEGEDYQDHGQTVAGATGPVKSDVSSSQETEKVQ